MTDIPTTIPQKAEEIRAKAMIALGQAKTMMIVDQSSYESAGALISDMKQYENMLDAERKSVTKPLDNAKSILMGWFRPVLEKLSSEREALDKKMVTYYRAEEKKRLAEEARLAEIARKEREKLERQAQKAAEKGQEEKAEILTQAASLVQTPIVEAASKRTADTTIVQTWSAQVYDKLSLIKAVAEGAVSMEYLDANMTALNQAARSQKGTLSIPGVRAKSEGSVRRK